MEATLALAKTIRFGQQVLLLGDRATPTETFAAPCVLTTLGFSTNISLVDTTVPDCDDPDLSAWIESETSTQQLRITG